MTSGGRRMRTGRRLYKEGSKQAEEDDKWREKIADREKTV